MTIRLTSGWASWVAEVDSRATPTSRSAIRSGCFPARVSRAIPPIECATTTTGPSGAAVASTAARSDARSSIVECPEVARVDRPCDRWS